MFFDGLPPDIEVYNAENGRFGVLVLTFNEEGEFTPELHVCTGVEELVELIKVECSAHLVTDNEDQTADKEA